MRVRQIPVANLLPVEALKLVAGNLGGRHPDLRQHLAASLHHHRGATKIEFDGADVRMVTKIFVEDDLMDESRRAVPLILRQRGGKRQVQYLNLGPAHTAEMASAEGMMMSNAPEIPANRPADSHGMAEGSARPTGPAPLLRNYLLCALAGFTWYLQFFFYSMGETKMGAYAFSSWTLHMASIIIFSTLWGLFLHEWRGSGRRTMKLVWLGLLVLVASTIIVGYGNYLGASAGGH